MIPLIPLCGIVNDLSPPIEIYVPECSYGIVQSWVPCSQCFEPFGFLLSLPHLPGLSLARCFLPRSLQWLWKCRLLSKFEKIHTVYLFCMKWWFKKHNNQLSKYPPQYHMIFFRKPNDISQTWKISCSEKIQKMGFCLIIEIFLIQYCSQFLNSPLHDFIFWEFFLICVIWSPICTQFIWVHYLM